MHRVKKVDPGLKAWQKLYDAQCSRDTLSCVTEQSDRFKLYK